MSVGPGRLQESLSPEVTSHGRWTGSHCPARTWGCGWPPSHRKNLHCPVVPSSPRLPLAPLCARFSPVVSLTAFHTPTCWGLHLCQLVPSILVFFFFLNLKVLASGPPDTWGKCIWLGEQLPSTQIAFLACISPPPPWPVTWNALILGHV